MFLFLSSGLPAVRGIAGWIPRFPLPLRPPAPEPHSTKVLLPQIKVFSRYFGLKNPPPPARRKIPRQARKSNQHEEAYPQFRPRQLFSMRPSAGFPPSQSDSTLQLTPEIALDKGLRSWQSPLVHLQNKYRRRGRPEIASSPIRSRRASPF